MVSILTGCHYFSVSINGVSYSNNFQAIADTGTSFIIGNATVVANLMAKVGAIKTSDGYYIVAKSALVSMPSN